MSNIICPETIHSGYTDIGKLIANDIFNIRDHVGKPHPYSYLRRLVKTRKFTRTVYPQ